MLDKSLIVFVKNPVEGHVKTRLAKGIGDKNALKVYLHLMERTKELCLSLKVNRFLFYDTSIIEEDAWDAELFQKRKQSQGNLGKRMSAAFQAIFAEKDGPVVIIGSDCYDLSKEIVNKAFEQLKTKDFVLGPTFDGGYYLLGMKKFHSEVFNDIDWSTELVFNQSLERIEDLNKTYGLLDKLSDIDHKEDLNKELLELIA